MGCGRRPRGDASASAPRRTRGRSTGVWLKARRMLAEEERAVVRAIPVTSPARTLVDLAPMLTSGQLAATLGETDRRGLLDVKAVERALARVKSRHGQGHARLRAALDAHAKHGAVLIRSWLEERFLDLVLDAGSAAAATQRPRRRLRGGRAVAGRARRGGAGRVGATTRSARRLRGIGTRRTACRSPGTWCCGSCTGMWWASRSGSSRAMRERASVHQHRVLVRVGRHARADDDERSAGVGPEPVDRPGRDHDAVAGGDRAAPRRRAAAGRSPKSRGRPPRSPGGSGRASSRRRGRSPPPATAGGRASRARPTRGSPSRRG